MNRATQFLGQQRAPHRVAPAAERGPMRKARIPLKFRCECGDKGTVHRHTAAYPAGNLFMYEACALYWERTGGYASMSSVMHEPFAGYVKS